MGEMLNSKRIIFLTIAEAGYSRSWTYFNGAKKLGENVEFIKIYPSTLVKQFFQIRQHCSKECIFIIMSPSQYLALFARLFLGKRIVLDAGWSLFEGTVISRKRYGIFGMIAIKNYLIDFISSHAAKKIILESHLQRRFYTKLLLVRRKKCYVLYTGVDEDAFLADSKYVTPPDIFKNSKIVLFRGKYNPEAGVEVLAEATKILSEEKITFWVFCPGLPTDIVFSKNTFINRDMLSKDKIAKLQKTCAISLGQLAKHKRLSRTIPHKAFESAFLATPYLTANNRGIMELFTEEEVMTFPPGDSFALAAAIKNLVEDRDKILAMSSCIERKYQNVASQIKLAQEFASIIGL